MTIRYLINRYATMEERRILRVEDSGEGEYVMRENGSRALRLGDCFDTFEQAKAEWIERCRYELHRAEEDVNDAQERYERACALAPD